MKLKALLFAVIMLFAITTSADSAGKKNYSSAITGDPISLIWGTLFVTYEMQMSDINSLTIYGSIYSYSGWTAIGVGGSYRWYIVKESNKGIIEGFGFGPRITFGSYSHSDYTGGLGVNIGAEAAYKWIWSGFVLEPIFVLSFPITSIDSYSPQTWGLGVNVGYAW